jgi:hypothetical protein
MNPLKRVYAPLTMSGGTIEQKADLGGLRCGRALLGLALREAGGG